jgi:hypothetical protein
LKIFLHYSWDNEAHKDWVLNLANRLVADGVDLFFDRYDLKPGSNNTHFMEQIEKADKVVLIMSEGYKVKADDRKGGIGYEFQMVTTQLAKKLFENSKYIPVLKGVSADLCIPAILQSFLYIDMSSDILFENRYLELLRGIYDEPVVVKPQLGTKPSFPKVSQNKESSPKKSTATVFELGWSKKKTKKVLGKAQVYDGLQEQYWTHGLEVYYNRHWGKVDGVLAKNSPTGVDYEGDVCGIKIGDTFAEVKNKLGNPLNWGIPDPYIAFALYKINQCYLTIPLWRDVPKEAPPSIKQGTVMALSLSTEHSILSSIPIVIVAIEEMRQGRKPSLLERKQEKLNYDRKGEFLKEHYNISHVQIGRYGGYFVQVFFIDTNQELIFWLYDLSWDKFVIRALVQTGYDDTFKA